MESRHVIDGRAPPGVRPSGPTWRGAAGKERRWSGGREPTVLTDLLTTVLDYRGRVRSETPREQGSWQIRPSLPAVRLHGCQPCSAVLCPRLRRSVAC